MNILEHIRNGRSGILIVGNDPFITQSILDFDFLSGRAEPSVVALVTAGRKSKKFFFGSREILLPCVTDVSVLSVSEKKKVMWMLNLQSGRRVLSSTVSFFASFPDALGASIFAENVPEKHSIELMRRFSKEKFITGPASVGFLVPGFLKLGAVGGVDPLQIQAGSLSIPGNIAVGSTSGGMTNELIRAVVGTGRRISFAAAVGGDRFPVSSLTDVFKLAESDSKTEAFVYFGELGGTDEYEIIDLIRLKQFTKPLVAYIAGAIDEVFDERMQFGHAKALALSKNESAKAKREALKVAGVIAPDTFSEFLDALKKLPHGQQNGSVISIKPLMNRQKSILSTREIINLEKTPVFVKGRKLAVKDANLFGRIVMEALLGQPVRSSITPAFVENVFELLIDHGGQVSGAVNTMITARAGKDLVSSLTAGLLTIGPRFGGAVNEAARTWLYGVEQKANAETFVEERAKTGDRISGIGHRKYRVGFPDPRVRAISAFADLLKKHPYLDFAKSVEVVTISKNGSLILNVDGVIAALLLDILSECEKLSHGELLELVDAEFFNAFFVIPRSVGFIAHFIEQKRNDEGLFRLPDELLYVKKSSTSVSRRARRSSK